MPAQNSSWTRTEAILELNGHVSNQSAASESREEPTYSGTLPMRSSLALAGMPHWNALILHRGTILAAGKAWSIASARHEWYLYRTETQALKPWTLDCKLKPNLLAHRRRSTSSVWVEGHLRRPVGLGFRGPPRIAEESCRWACLFHVRGCRRSLWSECWHYCTG